MRQPFLLLTTAGAALLLAGCATVPPAGTPVVGAAPQRPAVASPVAPAASAPARTGGAAPATPPGSPPPFAVVSKDAQRSEGLITLWQKDEKVWLELRPEDFNKPFFLSPKVSHGIGESFLFGGLMIGSGGRIGRSQVVEFRRVFNQVQLIARNQQFIAGANTPEARAVERNFSDSLLASGTVASQPHPERKTVLVDANALLLGDMLSIGPRLQQTYRQGYNLDSRNTGFTSVRTTPEQTVFNVRAHFATAALAAAPVGALPGTPMPSVPTSLPDARSMFIGLYYSIAKLPESVMRTRAADPRLGHFTTAVNDFAGDAAPSTRQRYVDRWRLEKKDPNAALSEPVKPITFWIDRTVPLRYREAVTQGIVEWNKAFAKIGFKDAIVAKVQPDDAAFDTLDVGVASVRWITTSSPAFDGFGPSVTDPRSGEILDADIVLDGNAARSVRVLRSQVLERGDALDYPTLMQFGSEARLAALRAQSHAHADGMACEYGAHAGEQFGYALDVLASRGDIVPDAAVTEKFAIERIRAVTVHEVGHALGLRHNFRSSRVYTLAQIANPAFTAANGTTGSVMDYPDLNLPPPGVAMEKYGPVFRSALGPYDYWAIEYAYKPIETQDEGAELRRIAARNTERELAYGTDEDNALGIDPESLVFDLGDDPVAYANSRFAIARDLLERQEARVLSGEQNYTPLRRSVRFAVRDYTVAAGVLARQIGGVRTLRDFPGSGRDPLQPVPAAVQRDALDALARNVLSTDSLRLSAGLQRKLAPDFAERIEGPGVTTDYSIDEAVLGLQRALLGQLMSETVAARILDSQNKFEPGSEFRLSELYSRLTHEVWSEIDASRRDDILGRRRELQREYVNRLSSMLLRPSPSSRADARSLLRSEAQALSKRLDLALKKPGLSVEARAHLQDSAETLSQALAAKLTRVGV
ncbi:MAG TPA: zinc-dependent metalloprotease [Rubrivivax sp.]